MWLYFPDTRGLPLEEVAAIFGDSHEVAIYQRDIEIDPNHHIVEHKHGDHKSENFQMAGSIHHEEKQNVSG